jgi:nitrate reductase NapE component
VVASVELAGSLVTSVLAIAVPVLAVALVVALLVWMYRTSRRFFFGRSGAGAAASDDRSAGGSTDGR